MLADRRNRRARTRRPRSSFRARTCFPHFTALENVLFAERDGADAEHLLGARRPRGQARSPAARAVGRRGPARGNRTRHWRSSPTCCSATSRRGTSTPTRRARARPDRRSPGGARLRARDRDARSRTSPRGASASSSCTTVASSESERVTAFVLKLLTRTPLRTAVRAFVLMISVALLGAMVLFIGNSLRTMTATTVRSVPLDWQGPVGSAAAAAAGRRAAWQGSPASAPPSPSRLRRSPERSTRLRPARSAQAPASSSPCRRAISPSFHTFPDALRLARRATASCSTSNSPQRCRRASETRCCSRRARARSPVPLTGHGHRCRLGRRHALPAVDPAARPGSRAHPPADVAVMPFAALRQALRLGARRSRAVERVRRVRCDRDDPGSPIRCRRRSTQRSAPAARSTRSARRPTSATRSSDRSRGRCSSSTTSETSLTGAAGDALYAEALYIMLAVPGRARRSRPRLPRSARRGRPRPADAPPAARPRRLAARSCSGSRRSRAPSSGLFAGVVGAAARAAHRRSRLVGGQLSTWPWAVGVCVIVGFLGSFAGRVAAGVGALREEQRPQKPLWQRLYLDLVALAVSGLVWWLTARTGFSAVVSPDSNPTLSLSVYMFLAPALLWIGVDALARPRARPAVRAARARSARRVARDFLLVSAARRAAVDQPRPGDRRPPARLRGQPECLLGDVGSAVARRRPPDRRLRHRRLGRDSAFNPSSRTTPGITGTTALDHTYAYVGPDLQDVFAIDPSTFHHGTSLRDSVLPRRNARDR